MASLNKALIIGHLGGDPELRHTGGGAAVVNVSIATNEKWKDKDGGTKESTEWHRVVFFGKLAEIVAEYLKKGSMVYVEGRLQTREWEDKDGAKQKTTEVIASQMVMLGGKGESGGQTSQKPRAAAKPAARQAPPDFDDDIPF